MRNLRGDSSSDWSDWSPKNTTRGEGQARPFVGELLKSVVAPPVPRALGLCAFLGTSALIFAKDIIRLRCTQWGGGEEGKCS